MSLKLSKRLKEIVDMCEPCDTIIDVGTDHGKVAIEIANKNIAKTVLAVDNKKGPLEMCKKNVCMYMHSETVDFKILLSDGIKDLNKEVLSGIIIAGMGYDSIKSILSDIQNYNFKYIILSPHTKITELIEFLNDKNIEVVEQKAVLECKKNYIIMKAKKKEA